MSTENLSSVLNDELTPEEREQGYIQDDAGLTNTFAVEPEPYAAEPKWGFNQFAETFSGRVAMIGFDLLVLTELVTGKGIIHTIWG
ncbi:hypothetical protein [Acaryochloris sp. CCMEE 5410]|uniref:hypothetical protein n=1 Tax=Acaryochloris sp. CCMEE 5410 TaxID=310037 RepID=UPI00024848B6|nr:hypothetical protein [Acaryochloris sp. CCMEE 5410]KAI9132256.1 high light inducible protein [Acaryochloris sp. CCMEE 5410]